MSKRWISVLVSAILLDCLSALAQVPIEVSEGPTYIAPKYFGPYAFPVPDVNDGRMHSSLYAEAGCDGVVGHLASDKDYTVCPWFKIAVPLWTDRVNFLVFGDIHEFYWDNPEVRALRRVESLENLKSHSSGNIYFGLDVLALKEGQYRPSVVISATTQTASGSKYSRARHYDAAGYYFTVSVGKTFGEFHLSAYTGFLCWQTDRGRQNDALMLGAKASWSHKWFSAYAEYGTYLGREKEGDQPRAIKIRTDFTLGHFSPFLYYSHGFNDWPFDQLRAGLAWRL